MSPRKLSPGILSWGETHIARREHNEDSFLINDELGLAIVADGVGGHQAGEIASDITCKVIEREIGAGQGLAAAIRHSNKAVMKAVEAGEGRPGMASTVVAVQLQGEAYRIDWVGDSRAYLWDGALHLLTRDHSYVAAQLEQGKITMEEARNHPRKNVIVQAIGLQKEQSLRIGQNEGQLAAGEMLLLCSDGLNDVLENAQIVEILASPEPLASKCRALVDTTVLAGGKDNVTVVLIAADETIDGSNTQRPATVWSFDPVSGDYSGLPELDNEQVSGPRVKRVAPKGVGATQMMPIAQVEAMRKLAVQESRKSRRRLALWLVLLGLAAASVVYSLGLAFLDW